MTIVTKEQVIQTIEKLPPERLEEAWHYLEFLSAKADEPLPLKIPVPSDPEGAFPELDVSIEIIQEIEKDDWER